MEELWKDVIGYEGLYKISNKGNLYSLISKKIIKPSKAYAPNKKNGYYLRYYMSKDGKRGKVMAHRLVAMTFIGLPSDEKYCVNHIDGDKTNNNVENLEWCTLSKNIKHAYDNNLKQKLTGENAPASKLYLNEVVSIYFLYKLKKYTLSMLAEMFDISVNTIQDIVYRRSWKHVDLEGTWSDLLLLNEADKNGR